MSRGYLLLLALGLFAIYKICKHYLERDSVTFILKKYDTEILRNSDNYRKAEKQDSAFKITLGLVSINYALIIFNLSYNFIPGWYILCLTGIISAYCFWIVSKIPLEVKLFEASPENTVKITDELVSLKKGALVFLVFSLALSGNWAYQVTKNQGIEREIATNEALSIVGQGWCSNFLTQDAIPTGDGDYEISNTGGWPCITIRSVKNISFESKKNISKMCFWYQLKSSNSYPNNIDSETDFDYRELCATDRWLEGGGWTESNFSDEIYKGIKPDLDILQKDLCSLYYYRLDVEQRSVYC